MIEPHLKDDDLLQDIATAPAAEECFHLWWLGQSGFLLKWGQRFLLMDPYLSDSLTAKYSTTDKPHIRMTALPIDPARLDFINVVTSSHNHTDHLDAESLLPLLEASQGVQLLIPSANAEFVMERLGLASDEGVQGLCAGDSASLGDFECHAIPAAHEDRELDAQGRDKYLGYVFKFGSWSVYHSGDTVLFDGLEDALAGFTPDLALLPVNGRAAGRGVAGNLWGREAAKLSQDIGARLVVPCHYDMFSFNTATPDEFVQACHKIDQPYRVLRCAERWSSFELDAS
ncbi:MAG: MBL fold metallo-hydrolase [Planctomycetota bacterium]|nr:MBL fold metallo-hydrolase [Planctomycetota bacterium]